MRVRSFCCVLPTYCSPHSSHSIKYTTLVELHVNSLIPSVEQMYDVPDSSTKQSSGSQTIKAYLIGNIVNVTEATKNEAAKITVTFKLRKCSNNQLIAGGTVTGLSSSDPLTTDEKIMSTWQDSGLLIKLIAGAVVVLLIGIVFFIILRMMTGVR